MLDRAINKLKGSDPMNTHDYAKIIKEMKSKAGKEALIRLILHSSYEEALILEEEKEQQSKNEDKHSKKEFEETKEQLIKRSK